MHDIKNALYASYIPTPAEDGQFSCETCLRAVRWESGGLLYRFYETVYVAYTYNAGTWWEVKGLEEDRRESLGSCSPRLYTRRNIHIHTYIHKHKFIHVHEHESIYLSIY